jgi:hypothetical protein
VLFSLSYVGPVLMVCGVEQNVVEASPNRQQSDENNRKREWERHPLGYHCCDYVRTCNLCRGRLLISYVYIPDPRYAPM